jgi:hypothetical protein
MEKERYSTRHRLHVARGEVDYYLECFGDEIAKRKGYKDLDGMEAIQFYLMQTHHWLPQEVRAMNSDDIHFALSQEMHGWVAPDRAISAARNSENE